MLYLRMILLLSLIFVHTLGDDSKEKNCDSADKIKDQDDVMGDYRGLTEEQCRRLCWYRRPCRSFSARTECVAKDAIPCILHAEVAPVNVVYTTGRGWKRINVTGDDIENGCANRPCCPEEVCVPAFENHRNHTCLPHPAVCEAPKLPSPNALLQEPKGGPYKQGEELNVICADGFKRSVDVSPMTIKCLVTSRWSKLAETCLQEVSGSYSQLVNIGQQKTTSSPERVTGKTSPEGGAGEGND